MQELRLVVSHNCETPPPPPTEQPIDVLLRVENKIDILVGGFPVPALKSYTIEGCYSVPTAGRPNTSVATATDSHAAACWRVVGMVSTGYSSNVREPV